MFKKVEGFTKYYVCSDGYVYKDCGGTRGLKKLKGMPNSGGYRAIVMTENGHKERYLIHRLIAKYFIPNPDSKPYVDHINTDRLDNRPENLRWVTQKENMNNPLSVGREKQTKMEKFSVPVVCKKDGIEIRFDNQYFAANYFKCDKSYILEAAKTNKQIYGFQVFTIENSQKIAS